MQKINGLKPCPQNVRQQIRKNVAAGIIGLLKEILPHQKISFHKESFRQRKSFLV